MFQPVWRVCVNEASKLELAIPEMILIADVKLKIKVQRVNGIMKLFPSLMGFNYRPI